MDVELLAGHPFPSARGVCGDAAQAWEREVEEEGNWMWDVGCGGVLGGLPRRLVETAALRLSSLPAAVCRNAFNSVWGEEDAPGWASWGRAQAFAFSSLVTDARDGSRAWSSNPRPDQGARQRQRVLHKFSIYPDKFGEILCTGCGNCTRNCPEGQGMLTLLTGIDHM